MNRLRLVLLAVLLLALAATTFAHPPSRFALPALAVPAIALGLLRIWDIWAPIVAERQARKGPGSGPIS